MVSCFSTSAFADTSEHLSAKAAKGGLKSDAGAERICNEAESLLSQMEDVHYEHLKAPATDQIQESTHVAHTDCSGFVAYLLSKYAPNQYSAIVQNQPDKYYPQAKTYANYFSALKSKDTSSGWRKIENVYELKRGDFIAWAKPVDPTKKPGNSGHVAIVVATPDKAQEENVGDKSVRYVAIKVIDSSSVDHFAPDTLPPLAKQKHRDGLGEGWVRIVVDEQNSPIGYWEGTYWNEGDKPIQHPTYTSVIGFGRLTSRPDY